jgi:hypothetical protein
MELSGPAIYYSNKKTLNAEGYISLDLNEKRSLVFDAGYLNFKYTQDSTQHNYSYRSKGSYIRVGMDFNLLKPDKSQGKYFAGIGLRYGLSRFILLGTFFRSVSGSTGRDFQPFHCRVVNKCENAAPFEHRE